MTEYPKSIGRVLTGFVISLVLAFIQINFAQCEDELTDTDRAYREPAVVGPAVIDTESSTIYSVQDQATPVDSAVEPDLPSER